MEFLKLLSVSASLEGLYYTELHRLPLFSSSLFILTEHMSLEITANLMRRHQNSSVCQTVWIHLMFVDPCIIV